MLAERSDAFEPSDSVSSPARGGVALLDVASFRCKRHISLELVIISPEWKAGGPHIKLALAGLEWLCP